MAHRVLGSALITVLLGCGGTGQDGAPPGDGQGGGEPDADPGPAACAVAPPAGELERATTRGLVRGAREGESVVFRGIPFAAPPVGPLRLRPPEAPACWDEVRETTAFAPRCAQQALTGGVEGDEDCLYLNVWTPAGAASAPRPVLFWIHGGAQVMGSASESTGPISYDGRHLAETYGVVVVTTNYRLGALGFLAHPALAAESPRGVSGNYALLDLVAALGWVQGNVAGFGGDPSRVLVFGESAGAFNTCALVASPLAAGLFGAALMQSGVCEAPRLAERAARGVEIAAEVGCGAAADVAACLREAPVSELVESGRLDLLGTLTEGLAVDPAHASDLAFGPATDGWVLPVTPRAALASGAYNQVPLVFGTNANEFDLFLLPASILTCAAYQQRVASAFGDLAGAVLAEYPCAPFAAQETFSDLMSDLMFTCPTRRAARAAAAAGVAPVYRYWFDHRRALGAFAVFRAAHTTEIPFVFGTLGSLDDPATPRELELSDRIGGYWTRFAATGDPNGGAAPHWDPHTAGVMTLALEPSMVEGVRDAHCDFWDPLLPP